MGMVYCRGCGAQIHESAVTCPQCGAAQQEEMTGKNRVTAAIFALLLGGLGIHKFYLGKTLQGVVYLVFCWTFIPSLISFIEGIIYLTKTDKQFAQQYPG